MTDQSEAKKREATVHQESNNVKEIGGMLMMISLIGSVICAFVFGRVPIVHSDYIGGLSTREEWSIVIMVSWLCAGLSGALFGYLLKKIGSILRHLESMNEAKSETS